MAWTERYCSPTGAGAHDGTSAANAWTLAEAIAGVAAGHRVNVIAGTYANTTTTSTFATAGTTTSPIWWRGYNSTIGDLDSDFTTAKPAWTWTTGRMELTAGHNTFSNLSISGATTTTGVCRPLAQPITLHRCRIENTNAAAASAALVNNQTVGMWLTECWIKATSTATTVISGNTWNMRNCTVRGGGAGVTATTNIFAIGCNFIGNGGIGITSSGSMVQIDRCTFRGCGSDAIRLTTVPSSGGWICDCVFESSGGYDINNSSGTNTALVIRRHNITRSATSGHSTGFGDTPDLYQTTDSVATTTSATDMTPVSGSSALATGGPGLYENETFTSYLDRGSVQVQSAGGGGGGGLKLIGTGGLVG